jgi:hypothetical protein
LRAAPVLLARSTDLDIAISIRDSALGARERPPGTAHRLTAR